MMKLRIVQFIGLFVLVTLFIIIIFPLIGIYFFSYNIELKNSIFNMEVYKAVKGSVITLTGAVFITIPVSLICAFCITHSNIRFKTLFSFFCILPLFLPPISFGFSLLSIFGKNGLFYSIFGIRLPVLGEFGVIFGLVLYTFPVAFLMFRNSMLETDGAIYESAVLLGIPLIKYFFKITIPQIQKTIISVVFFGFYDVSY